MTAAQVTELFSLEGMVAVVTGATRRIGLATAEAFASAGATTILTGLEHEDPERVAARIADEHGLAVEGRTLDVTDHRALEDLVDFVIRAHGRLDVVFCNAGVALDSSPHTGGTEDQLEVMFDVHVRSVIAMANLTLPVIARGGGGTFLIMSSIAGVRGNRILGQYGITKAANAQLARNLAVQWGDRNIRVNSIAPGVIDTDLARTITSDSELADARLAKTPLRRFGEPFHIAGTALWLASPAGSFVSGQNIMVDGGTVISD
ncbi:SDR family NAD(P)-dependent oxidoreductase [Lacisediminihabitans profunda]|uniref:SDR family oxidoreductase n=1 Tax=Lacisediminihabitans profunda TaxID=2594790 RepID=A0A5C8UJC7_9MICO|nr:SDR family oxidoreductase [Lacisediminihabitans profunda]TXN28341.1 SDR family oxidoreductase [Lacisediminihabitans profunda]